MIRVATIAAGMIACGPMEIDVINETGAELVLQMNNAHGDPLVYDIPDGGALVEYTGAPSLNASYTVRVTVLGRHVLTDRSLDAVRKETNTLSFAESDVNAFAVDVTNNTGARIDSLWFSDEGPIVDGERPGDSVGALADGEAITVPLLSGGSYNFVYYQAGAGTVDNTGLSAEPGTDLILDL